MKHKVSNAFIITLIAFSSVSNYAMHSRTAYILTWCGVGTGAGLGAWYGDRKCKKMNKTGDCYYGTYLRNLQTQYGDHVIIGSCAVLSAILFGLGTKRFCFHHTSAGYLKRATNKRRDLDSTLLAHCRKVTDRDMFFDSIDHHYLLRQHPRIDALNDLGEVHSTLGKTKILLNNSLSAPEGKMYKQKSQNLLSELQEDEEHVIAAMLAIKNSPDYLKRLKAFHAKKLADAQERTAAAEEWNAAANTINAFTKK